MLSGKGWLKASLLGLGAGFFSGLFGVGGGIFMVPGLMVMFAQARKMANGTSLAAIVPIAAAGAASYAFDGAVNWFAALLLAVSGAVGVLFGTRLLKRVPVRVVRYAFALLLVTTAIRLIVDDLPDARHVDVTASVVAILLSGGVVAGALAGMLGIGGGLILVPLMIFAVGSSFDVARGTSLLVMIPTAVVGTWRNIKHQQTNVKLGLMVGTAGALGAVGGVATALRLDTQVAAVLFAVFLGVMAVRTALVRDRGEKVALNGDPPATDAQVIER